MQLEAHGIKIKHNRLSEILSNPFYCGLLSHSLLKIESSLNWWIEKIYPEDRKETKNRIKNFIKQGHAYCDVEYRFRCVNNQYKYFIDKGYIVYKDGKPVRAIGIVHDITEKKKLVARMMQEKIQKQKEIAQAIIATQDHVGNELGKELHDNVNQILSTANLFLDFSQHRNAEEKEECLQKSREYIQLAIQEIRRISKSLNTSIIKEVGFIKQVEEIISTLQMTQSFSVKFDCNPVLEQELSSELKLMIYRIIQEQTNNIIKYAADD